MSIMQAAKQMGDQMAAQLGAAAGKAAQKNMENNLEATMKQFDECMEAQMKEYRANQDEYHRAAFEVMDANKDKLLQESEVIACLMHGTPKNQEFIKALGLAPKQQSTQGPAGAGCPQQ